MTPPQDQKIELKAGFADKARPVTVNVPAGDARPWDLDSKLTVVGTDVPRVDGPAKVTGRAKYSYDINLPGLLQGRFLRSPHARARITSLDLAAARKMPGVHAVLEVKRAGNQCRYAGDEVAVVAAETLDQCQDAIEKIVVEYEVLEHNTNMLGAENAPQMDTAGNVVREPGGEKQAQLDEAFGKADVVREATYITNCQTHSSLETHGCVAWFKEDGKLEVWASTQGTFATKEQLGQALGIPSANVHVQSDYIGGGFGSKFNPGAEMRWAAELSRECGKPVKLMLSRKEEHIAVGNRPATIQWIKAGIQKDGKLLAWDQGVWGNAGMQGTGGGATSPGFYFDGTVTRRGGASLRTDLDAQRAFRAPGWPQGYFAFETMLDELADGIAMDPIALRKKLDKSELRRWEYDLGAERIGWKQHRNPTPGKGGRLVRGVGCSSAAWGGSGGNSRAQVTCRIHPDGTVEVRSGAQDIGTGMKTLMAILTAEELGIPVGQVKPYMGDTNDPLGPGSGGSVTTPAMAPVVRHAAFLAKQELCKLVAEKWKVDATTVELAGGQVAGKDGQKMSFADACKAIGPGPIQTTGNRFRNYRTEDLAGGVCGAYFAHVEVDTQTGLIKVLKMVGVQDCGRVIDKLTAESQVLGAMIQGISWVLHEDKIIDHRRGRMVNPDFLSYKIAGPVDIPEMEAHMVTTSTAHTNAGAMGLGEPPSVGVPGALSNAVRNALGVSVRTLPMTPDRVLAALSKRGV